MVRTPLAPGMRQTRQRRLVWEAVGRLGPHCTADEIALDLQRSQPGFSRSTVYRALEALTTSGVVRPVWLGAGALHYEVASEDHQHAVCQVCSGILHLEHELVSELEEHLEAMHRFRPLRTDVLVLGICEACARSRSPKRPRRRTLEHVHFPSP